jgi:hypothetical protein
MCNAVLWLNAPDVPPDMPPSSSNAADRLRSLDGALHTSINVTRCSVLHVWRRVMWSGNFEDRLSKDNTSHTCYIFTITFLVAFCFQLKRLVLSSEENTSTSGHVNIGMLNHIQTQTHTIQLQIVHKFYEVYMFRCRDAIIMESQI